MAPGVSSINCVKFRPNVGNSATDLAEGSKETSLSSGQQPNYFPHFDRLCDVTRLQGYVHMVVTVSTASSTLSCTAVLKPANSTLTL